MRVEVSKIKELMVSVSYELGLDTYMASEILDTLCEKGLITEDEREKYR